MSIMRKNIHVIFDVTFLLYIFAFHKILATNGPASSSSLLHRAVAEISVVNFQRNLFVVYQYEPAIATSLLNKMWLENLSFKFLSSKFWMKTLNSSNYNDQLNVILLGDHIWAEAQLKQTAAFYNLNILNIQNIRFLWVYSNNMGYSHSNIIQVMENTVDSVKTNFKKSLKSQLQINVLLKAATNAGLSRVLMFRNKDGGTSTSKSELQLVSLWTRTERQQLASLWPPVKWDLSNTTWRITHVEKRTAFESDSTKTLEGTSGYCAEIFKLIQRTLGFNVVLVPASSYGNIRANGSASGMVGVLMRNEADLAPLDFNPTPARRKGVDFVYDIGTDVIRIMTRVPGQLPRPFILFQILTLTTWLCIMSSVIFMGIMLGIVNSMSKNVDARNITARDFLTSILNGFLLVLMAHLNQSITKWPTTSSSKIVCVTALLAALVFVATYTGSITAFLAIPVMSRPVNNVNDAVNNKLTFAVRLGTSFSNILLQSDSTLITSRMLIVPGSKLRTSDYLKQVEEYILAVLDSESALIGYRAVYEKENSPCVFYVGKSDVFSMPDAFAVQRNSPYKIVLDNIVKWFRYYGIIDKIKKDGYKALISCKPMPKRFESMALNMAQMQSSFYILVMGLIISTLVMLLEYMKERINLYP